MEGAEDEASVRIFTRKILEMHGYLVLEAQDGKSALRISEEHTGLIHLLLTDVIMPGMNGRELSDQFLKQRPDAAVVFMSGYTDDAIVKHGILEGSARFIQKPFVPGQLAKLLREVLDARETGRYSEAKT